MKATQTLPENVALAWQIDLEKDKRLMVLLQVIAIPWSLLVLALLGLYAYWLKPGLFDSTLTLRFSLWSLLALLAVSVLAILLHEWVHGLFFWQFTREKPKFGFKGLYAYASAPGWYFDKSIYWLIGLAPLVLLSLAGLLAALFIPQNWLFTLLFGIFINASGAIGDLYIVIRLAFEPAGTLVGDQGTSFSAFRLKP
ncbi:MAG: DUF3267 domain-containing protein [Anaerolineales bacterium]|jgi:hypothetical protein|nr:DUF3267 domain-containing protein [Anaerolineales bacterium]